MPLPLEARLAVLPCRGGDGLLRRLFEPLGYAVGVQGHPLDERFPDWGQSPYFSVGLVATVRLHELLSHLYVLVPVLDDEKHYWVSDEEVDKLLRHGAGWLAEHPERELIARRYLKYRHSLAREAVARLAEGDRPDPDAAAAAHADEEATVEAPISLNQHRLNAVLAALKEAGARRVVDLGCGEGRLLKTLLEDGSFEELLGMDVSRRALERARERLPLDRRPARAAGRVDLIQGALTYRDKRLAGYDAATVVEVIEHLDPPRLAAFERVLFELARPSTVVLTTPNVEYNVKFGGLPAGRFRHRDHRFEWTRAELRGWAEAAAERFGYGVCFRPVGPEDRELGSPTQMAIFSRKGGQP